ncbi:MAG: saccharopine dehydrogenase NADP-binding domain-containing protein [Crocinitomicaceae bacterium]
MKIVLVGAYGYTGRIICEMLQEQQIRFTAAGKDEGQISQLLACFPAIEATKIIDISQPEMLPDFIAQFDLFINCAGPFTEESQEFVKAVANSEKKYYLDISGELNYVRRSRENYHETAKANQTLLIHACAFESFIADLGYQLLSKGMNHIKSIKTYYHFEKSRPSPGTKITMKLSALRKFDMIKNSAWQVISSVSDQETVKWRDSEPLQAVPYPLPEVAFFHWQTQAEQIGSYMLLEKEASLFVGTKTPNEAAIPEQLELLKQRKGSGPSAEERKQQQSTLYIEISGEDSQKKRLRLICEDMYQITASCIGLLVDQIRAGKCHEKGVLRPAVCFSDERTVLQKLGVEVQQTEEIGE